MEEWTAKRQAVAALTGVLSEAEMKRMLSGIDLEIKSLRKYLDELDGGCKIRTNIRIFPLDKRLEM